MKIGDIEDRGSVMVVDIPQTKTGVRRHFTIVEENEFSALSLVRNYMSVRPSDVERFFLTYRAKRCTHQPIGKNTFGKIPSQIASVLGLRNPNSYTGHCLRRTSATALVNAGANMTMLKRHGGWRSSTVAEGYLEDSIEMKKKTARMLAGMSDDTKTATASFSNALVDAGSSLSGKPLISSGGGNSFSGNFENCKFFVCNSFEDVKALEH